MSIEAAEMFWMGVAAWLGVGFAVALLFALWAAPATDHAAQGSGLLFRFLIIPGAALLWPWMVIRLLSGRRINAPIPGRDEPH